MPEFLASRCRTVFVALWVLLLLLAGGPLAHAESTSVVQLREAYAAAKDDPALGISDRPIYLQSKETSDSVQGDVYALLSFPYDEVRQSLVKADDWCRILILHLNVQYCRAAGAAPRQTLTVGLGRKFDQPLGELYWLDFSHSVARAGDDYLAVELRAPAGPLGTRDYRIAVEAIPLAERRTLLHLRYAYAYGMAARLATQAYLATLASGKVGFSVVGQRGAVPQRVGGVRGVLERNTMRYYLAIESHLGARELPAAQRLSRSLQDWFAATERYPQQLHEVERDAYLEMKLREVVRQEKEAPPRRQ